jgi:primosomal protein N'
MKEIKGKGTVGRVVCPDLPEFITCPTCGLEMELWFDEEEMRCVLCGYRFFRREATVH